METGWIRYFPRTSWVREREQTLVELNIIPPINVRRAKKYKIKIFMINVFLDHVAVALPDAMVDRQD